MASQLSVLATVEWCPFRITTLLGAAEIAGG